MAADPVTPARRRTAPSSRRERSDAKVAELRDQERRLEQRRDEVRLSSDTLWTEDGITAVPIQEKLPDFGTPRRPRSTPARGRPPWRRGAVGFGIAASAMSG